MNTPFIDLKSTHNPNRYHLAIRRVFTVGQPGRQFLFGGVALAAAIEAMQRATARPVIWATAQYLSFARPEAIVDFDVWVPSKGRFNSQARVIGHVGEDEIITVNAALGERQDSLQGQWLTMPDVPPPDDCPAVVHRRTLPGDLKSIFEKRLVQGRYPIPGEDMFGTGGEGRLVMWVRGLPQHPIDAALLAVIADFASEVIPGTLGRMIGGNSFDNTIRYVKTVPTEWVLCDFRLETIHAGTAHTVTHLYAEDGSVLAIASQSLILRYHDTN